MLKHRKYQCCTASYRCSAATANSRHSSYIKIGGDVRRNHSRCVALIARAALTFTGIIAKRRTNNGMRRAPPSFASIRENSAGFPAHGNAQHAASQMGALMAFLQWSTMARRRLSQRWLLKRARHCAVGDRPCRRPAGASMPVVMATTTPRREVPARCSASW